MPKRDKDRPKMRDLPIEEQDAQIARYHTRAEVSAAGAQLVKALRQWVRDATPDYERFNARGHRGQYAEWPTDTLAAKLHALGWTVAEIEAAKQRKETPLNYMDTEELGHVYQRIQTMLQYFERQPPGTFDDACVVYERFGELVRQAVYDQTGHMPEQYPTPERRITGQEAPSTFAPRPYRAPLFPEEEQP